MPSSRVRRDNAYSNVLRGHITEHLRGEFTVTVRDAIEIGYDEVFAPLGDPIVRTWYGPSAGPSCVVMWQTLAHAVDSGPITLDDLASSIGLPITKTNRESQCVRTLTRMISWMPLAKVSYGLIEMPDSVRFPHSGQCRKWSKLNKLENAVWMARHGYSS